MKLFALVAALCLATPSFSVTYELGVADFLNNEDYRLDELPGTCASFNDDLSKIQDLGELRTFPGVVLYPWPAEKDNYRYRCLRICVEIRVVKSGRCMNATIVAIGGKDGVITTSPGGYLFLTGSEEPKGNLSVDVSMTEKPNSWCFPKYGP